jgi:hypothetical protein
MKGRGKCVWFGTLRLSALADAMVANLTEALIDRWVI